MNDKPSSKPEAPPAGGPGEPQPPQQQQEPEENLEGTNATIHHPDPRAEEHPVRPGRKPRFSYTTGNH